jgi:hypothetical protein
VRVVEGVVENVVDETLMRRNILRLYASSHSRQDKAESLISTVMPPPVRVRWHAVVGEGVEFVETQYEMGN